MTGSLLAEVEVRDPDDLPPVIFAERYEQGAEEAPAAPVPPTTSIRCDVLRRMAPFYS